MHIIEFQLLFLILVANGAPVLGAALFRDQLAWPLDGGVRLPDGHPLLGSSKTWRGVLLALTATPVMALLLGLPLQVGLTIGLFAMLGDALSSFAKRRLGLPPSSMALGIDQIPECLLPLLAVQGAYALSWLTLLEIVAGFFVLELLLSRILYQIKVRKHPY